MIEAIRAYPWNWAAWLELAASLKDVVMLERVDRLLPSNHLFKPFWRAHALLELQQNEPALKLYHELAAVFPHSSYIRGQTAVANYNLQGCLSLHFLTFTDQLVCKQYSTLFQD